jgi:hypothetical protein
VVPIEIVEIGCVVAVAYLATASASQRNCRPRQRGPEHLAASVGKAFYPDQLLTGLAAPQRLLERAETEAWKMLRATSCSSIRAGAGRSR